MDPPPNGPRDGATYDPERDEDRLNRQARDVWRVMCPGGWFTLADIAEDTGWPEASISARIRDFRKTRYGAHTIHRLHVADGLHIYRMEPNPNPTEPETMPNTNRLRGDYLERQVRDALRDCKWVVVRSAGSLGPADIIAIRYRFTPLLIACKTHGKLGPAERLELRGAAAAGGARALMATRTKRGWIDLHVVFPDTVGPRIDQIKVPTKTRD